MKINKSDIGVLIDIFENKKNGKDKRDKEVALIALDIINSFNINDKCEIEEYMIESPEKYKTEILNWYYPSEDTY